jgi:hypothetical protein
MRSTRLVAESHGLCRRGKDLHGSSDGLSGPENEMKREWKGMVAGRRMGRIAGDAHVEMSESQKCVCT